MIQFQFRRSFSGSIRICFLLVNITFKSSEGHRTPGYNHDRHSDNQNRKWMASIKDSTPLFDISMPGTHDSLSLGYGGDIVQCQSLPLEMQLKSGIRAFDVRCRHFHDKFAIHHGEVFQHIWFDQVLSTMVNFLQTYQSEVLLVRVKQEYTPAANNRTFPETFRGYRNQIEFKDFIWSPGAKPYPNLGDVRGRIVILDNFSDTDEFGLNYRNPERFVIQDHSSLGTNWDLYRKWLEVKMQLVAAHFSRNKMTPRPFYVNYLSGSRGSFPYFVASGHSSSGTGAPRLSTGLTTPGFKSRYPDFPRISCFLGICTIAFEGTNVLTYNTLKLNQLRYVGVVMSDFPGEGLIDSIIKVNFIKDSTVLDSWSWSFIVTLVILLKFFIAGLFALYYFSRDCRSDQKSDSILIRTINNSNQFACKIGRSICNAKN